ncbi:MAG: RTX toxin [Chloracidobacterium sp.]|nr:RTX toxin [Chloracidobacterium sp.]
MNNGFQKFTERFAKIIMVLIGLAVAGSIMLNSGCSMTTHPNTPMTMTVPDTTPPISAITSPKAGAAISIGITNSVSGTASDTGGGSVARVEVSVDGGATYSAATGTTAWSFSWTPATPGSATIRSRAVDTSGNVQNSPAQVTVTVAVGGSWTAQGPGPSQNGQVENITPNNEVVGAIQALAPHPTDANILYVGGVNGGVWRTSNAKAASPAWTPLTDNFPSLSIGALEFDPTDATSRTLVAGIGRFSSFSRIGGQLTGILRTTDGGDNWTQISPDILNNQNISGVAARGSTLLASSTGGGLYRSVDGGANWTLVSGGNGLTAGGIFDLAGDPDPSHLNRFYVTVQKIGVFGSTDGGASWTNISSGDSTLNGAITNAQNNNARMAVGNNGRLYVIVVVNGQAQYIGFSDNPSEAAPTWTAMDLPQTPEATGNFGINPGGQGSIHLSIAADRNNPNTVYVAGDRQPGKMEGSSGVIQFPNFIGADNFTGRLFRGDTTVPPAGPVPPSPQWQHLTHSNSIAQIPGGGTAHNSSPHADSRKLMVDASGDLINVNDGGVYRRTSPQSNTGDWFSINGNIQTTEFHDVAYDTISNTIIFGGAQDNFIPEQITQGSTTWSLLSSGGGDGGDVAVDNITLKANNQSIRYSSSQNLDGFRRDTYDSTNKLVNTMDIVPTVLNGGAALQKQFVTPVELNVIDPKRLVIGGSNAVYESLTQGDTITLINSTGNGTNANWSAMTYGGRSGGADNPDVLYASSGSTVFLRTTAGAALAPTSALPGAGTVRDVALDPDDWKSAYVVDSSHVFRTTDAGATWTDITGNLAQFGAGDFNTNAFVGGANTANKLLLVGTNAGVFVSYSTSGFTHWDKLGAGLPNVVVKDLVYDVADDVLLAGTLGRGAWTITNLRNITPPAEP